MEKDFEMEDRDSISDALLRKEKELQHLAKLRISQLQEQLTLKDQYASELQQRLKRVCEDFNYNFQLIEERDRELASLEQQVAALTSACKAKDADVSDMRRLVESKEDDYRAESDFTKQQLVDAQETIKELRNRESQALQLQEEANFRLDSLEQTLREKERDLAKASAVISAQSSALEDQRLDFQRQITAEKSKFERSRQEDREKYEELLGEHRKCGQILKDCEKRLREETNTLQILSADKDGQLEESERKVKTLEEEKSTLSKEVQRLRRDKEVEITEIRAKMVDESTLFQLKDQIRTLQDSLTAANSQKSTLEGVISSLERELDLERKERSKDKRLVRDTQARIESETSMTLEKNSQWQTIAESRAEEVNTARVRNRQRNLVQAEEQGRQLERELARTRKALEIEKERGQEEAKRNAALMAQIAALEREKARLIAEARTSKGSQSEPEVNQLKVEIQTLRRDKMVSDQALRDLRVDLETRLSPQAPKPSSIPMLSPDSIPSRDPRPMAGLKQRLARVKDQLETQFHSNEGL